MLDPELELLAGTSWLFARSELDRHVDTLFVDLHRGDRLLLCTDGVHGQIRSEARLAQLVRGGSVQNAVQLMIGEAGRKGLDNATAVLAPRLVLLGFLPDQLSPGDGAKLWCNAIEYLLTAPPTAALPTTWGAIKALFR